MIVELKTQGADNLMAKMQAMLDAARTGIPASFDAGAERIAESARRRAPTADIARSIEVEQGPNGARVVVHDPLARLFEYGTGPRMQVTTGRRTGSMPAEPFLRPAMDEEEQRAVEEIAATLGQTMTEAAR